MFFFVSLKSSVLEILEHSQNIKSYWNKNSCTWHGRTTTSYPTKTPPESGKRRGSCLSVVVAAIKPIPPIPLIQKSKAPFIKQTKSQNFATQISHMLPDFGALSLWSPTVSTTSSHTSPLTANQQALICRRHYYKPNQSVNECCEKFVGIIGFLTKFQGCRYRAKRLQWHPCRVRDIGQRFSNLYNNDWSFWNSWAFFFEALKLFDLMLGGKNKPNSVTFWAYCLLVATLVLSEMGVKFIFPWNAYLVFNMIWIITLALWIFWLDMENLKEASALILKMVIFLIVGFGVLSCSL